MNARQTQGWWIVGAGMIAVVLVLLAFMYSVGGALVSDDQLGAKTKKVSYQAYECTVRSCSCSCSDANGGTVFFETEGFEYPACEADADGLLDAVIGVCNIACELEQPSTCDPMAIEGAGIDTSVSPQPNPSCTPTGKSCTW